MRRASAEQDLGVAWMVGYYYKAYANALDFYKARDSGDLAGMKRIAAEEIRNTEEAFRLVRADSRLGGSRSCNISIGPWMFWSV